MNLSPDHVRNCDRMANRTENKRGERHVKLQVFYMAKSNLFSKSPILKSCFNHFKKYQYYDFLYKVPKVN